MATRTGNVINGPIGISASMAFRLHTTDDATFANVGANDQQVIYSTNTNTTTNVFRVRHDANNTLQVDFPWDCSGSTSFSLADKKDISVLVTRAVVGSQSTLKVTWWDLDTGNTGTYDASCGTVDTTNRRVRGVMVGHASASSNMAIAFVRVYSTVLAHTTPPHRMDASLPDIAGFEWEDDTVNTVGGGSMTLAGSGFVDSRSPLPNCASGSTQTIRALTDTLTLDGNGIFPNAEGTANGVYLWRLISAPTGAKPVWSSQYERSPTLRNLIRGEYEFSATITGGGTTSCTVKHGVVAATSKGLVITGSSEKDFLMGPLPIHGSADWPAIDSVSREFGNYWRDRTNVDTGAWGMQVADWQTPNMTGNVKRWNPVDGSGTRFKVEGSGTSFCSAPPVGFSPTGSCPYTMGSDPADDNAPWSAITIHAPDSDITGVTLNYVQGICTVVSNTELTICTGSDWRPPTMTDYAPYGDGDAYYDHVGTWFGTNHNSDYYDGTEATYSEYWRSGLTELKIAADFMADSKASFPSQAANGWTMNGGSNRLHNITTYIMRMLSTEGMTEGEIEDHTDKWQTILKRYWDKKAADIPGVEYRPHYNLIDREWGYEIRDMALGARFVDDATKRTTYLGAIRSLLNGNATDVGWGPRGLIPTYNPTYGMYFSFYSGHNFIFKTGTYPVASAGANPNSLASINTNTLPKRWVLSGVNLAMTGSTGTGAITVGKKVWTCVAPCREPADGDRQVYTIASVAGDYSYFDTVENYVPISGQCSAGVCNDRWWTIEQGGGADQVALTGQPWHMMIIASHLYFVADVFEWAETEHAYADTCEYPYGGEEMACSEAARLLADDLFDSMTSKGLIPAEKRGGSWYWKYNPWCEGEATWDSNDQPYNPITESRTGCFFGPGGNHVTLSEYLGAAVQRYLRSFDSGLKTTYDEQFNLAFSWEGAPSGFSANTLDTGSNNFANMTDDDPAVVASENNRKYWGMFQGVGAATGWMMARKLVNGEWPHVPIARTAQITFNLADHANATKVRISATDANGTAVDFGGPAYVECASSPCEVDFPDREMGGYMVVLTYLDAGDVVKATTGARRVRIK